MLKEAHKRTRVLKKILFGCASSLLGMLLVVVVLEGFVRFGVYREAEPALDIYENDMLLGWKLRNGLKRTFLSPEFNINIKADGNGFRNTIVTGEISPEEYRIVGLGDSFLFGYGVESEETVLSVLCDALNADHEIEPEIYCTNLGMPGYNINQYFQIVDNEFLELNPDIAIVFIYMNDFKRDLSYDFWKVNEDGFLLTWRFKELNEKSSFMSRCELFVKRHLYLYHFLRTRIKVLMRKANLYAAAGQRSQSEKRCKYTCGLVFKMWRICANKNVPMILCIIPDKIQVQEGPMSGSQKDGLQEDELSPNEDLRNCLVRFANENAIPYIDLWEVFSSRHSDPASLYFQKDGHWNVRGHTAAADALYDYLTVNGTPIKRR